MFSKNQTFKYIINYFLICFLSLGIVACSSSPVVREFPPSASPINEISFLEKDLSGAQKKQVDLLSPQNFKEASDSLEKAKKLFLDGKDSTKILHNIALGKAYLFQANTIAEVAREKIEDVMIARQAALDVDAPTYSKKAFMNADDELRKITKDIEQNRTFSTARDQKSLQQKYLSAEIESIKEKNLRESRKIISEAKKNGAKKYAPRTLEIAEKLYLSTEAYVQANPHNSEVIQSKAEETKEAAYRAYNLNRIAKDSSKVSSEEMAIIIEQERERANQNADQLSSVKDELQITQSALEKEKETQSSLLLTKEELASKNEKLESQKIFNEKYERAVAEFDPTEAEVYKQGEALLIRLKGIQFPNSTSVIKNGSYTLLSKVQKVLADFGSESDITIQGHTDSLGKKTKNHSLSVNRAKAVKDYLEANSGGIDFKIETMGLSDEKPIASNKTAAGRAQNRRVDIIIKPNFLKI